MGLDDNGTKGASGNNGKSTPSAGSFIISGNVVLTVTSGKTEPHSAVEVDRSKPG